MLPKTYLTQLVPPRIMEAAGRLKNQIWQPVAGPLPVTRSASSREHRPFRAIGDLTFKPVKRLPHVWGRMHDQCWWELTLDLPEDLLKSGETLYLDWRDQGEATLYADGVPWHGIDPGHKIIPLPPAGQTLHIESTCLRSGIWVANEAQGVSPEGSEFRGAFVCTRDDDAWEAWVELSVLIEVLQKEHATHDPERRKLGQGFGYLPTIEQASPLFRKLTTRLDEAVDKLDSKGLPAFRRALRGILRDFPAYPDALECVLTGHAHIDLVWLWPESVGEAKAVHTFSTMNRLMDRFPEMIFGYSQPASYEAVERRSPELMEAVRQRIAQGSWEPVGATYVESDTQLSCGENLVRSFLIGQKGFEALTGRRSSVLWIPDVFGYTGCLPQIMAQTDVPRFFTTKLTWGNISRFPHSSFRWIGNDGTEVLVHVTQAYGYNGTVNVDEINSGQLNYRQADVHDAYLAPTGFGDGGGGVTEEMCLRARVLANMASMPKTRWGKVEQFFEELDGLREKLPAYQGELYLEYHRGVHTTHGDLKAAFRAAERGLQVWEAARCALDRRAVDEQAWKRLVFAQFHDYIPGSSIHEVNMEAVPELQAIAADAEKAAVADLSTGGKQAAASVFNPLPYPQFHYAGPKAGWSRVPALAGLPATDLEPVSTGPVEASTRRLKNDRVDARFDAQGRITRLSVDGEAVPFTAPAGQLVYYPDFPVMFHAWDIDRNTLANPQPQTGKAEVEVRADQPDKGTEVRFTRTVCEASRVTTVYRLDGPEGVLRIRYLIDWQDRNGLLKAVFPTDFRGRHARYGSPFGSALRVQQAARPDDDAMFENPFSRWVSVADDSGQDGFFAVTEAKYGATVFEGNVQISLVRSAQIIDAEKSPAIRRVDVSETFSDLMEHDVSLAIGRTHADTSREDQPAALADRLFTRPVPYEGEAVSAGFHGLTGGPTFQPAWAKPAEAADGSWILRCHETDGRRGAVTLDLAEGWRAEAVDLLERPLDRQPDRTGLYRFRPYELVSFRIRKAG
ncbi:MAG: alpha-mannosidase [Opitutales bacterium]